jgi:putative transposase
VLRRQLSGRLRWDHAGRLWLTALSRLVNRRRWAEIFPVTAVTILRWRRRLAVRKRAFTGRRRPGRPSTGVPVKTRRAAGPAWQQFLTAQAHASIACDFLVAGTVLLQRWYVLVFTGHGTRRLHLGGVTAHPAGARAVQQARNLAMDPG